MRWCVFCLVGVLVLGSYNYFQNLGTYGNPIGPSKYIEHFSGKKSIEKIVLNAIRIGYEACDFRGLPQPLESYLFNQKESFGKQFLTNKTITEQYVRSPAKFTISFKTKPHYTEIEFSWVGDFNPKMRKIFMSVGNVSAKHYITYRYLFDRNAVFKRYPIPTDDGK